MTSEKLDTLKEMWALELRVEERTQHTNKARAHRAVRLRRIAALQAAIIEGENVARLRELAEHHLPHDEHICPKEILSVLDREG